MRKQRASSLLHLRNIKCRRICALFLRYLEGRAVAHLSYARPLMSAPPDMLLRAPVTKGYQRMAAKMKMMAPSYN